MIIIKSQNNNFFNITKDFLDEKYVFAIEDEKIRCYLLPLLAEDEQVFKWNKMRREILGERIPSAMSKLVAGAGVVLEKNRVVFYDNVVVLGAEARVIISESQKQSVYLAKDELIALLNGKNIEFQVD